MLVQTVGALLNDRVTLDLEGIDRLYLNLYQPRLQTGGGVATFFKVHRGAKVASTVLMAPISRAFVKAIEGFAQREGVEIGTRPSPRNNAKTARWSKIPHQAISARK